MAKAIPFDVGTIYHIYNRGADHRSIFTDRRDYLRFICLLYACNDAVPLDIKRYFADNSSFFMEGFSMLREQPIVDIGAYCLMPNHYHLLLHEREQGGISKFMQKIKTAYVMYFNIKHKRTGTLFEGRFKGSAVTDEAYLWKVFSYIHLNPISLVAYGWKEEGLSDVERVSAFLENYEYSSYLDYHGKERPQKAILNRNPQIWHTDLQSIAEFGHSLEVWLRDEDSDKNALVMGIEKLGRKKERAPRVSDAGVV